MITTTDEAKEVCSVKKLLLVNHFATVDCAGN